MANGKICYVELAATDISKSSSFYTKIFGWPMRTRGDGAVAFDDTAGAVSGAFVTDRRPSTDTGVMVYVMVDDAQDMCASISANGGQIIRPTDPDAREVFAWFEDPGGNVLGIYQHND